MAPAFDALLARSPAQPLFLRRRWRALAALAYHGVEDRDVFARQLDWLRDHDFWFLTAAAAADCLAGRRDPPARAVLVTFDDGDRSVLEEGLPVLAERKVPAVVFGIASLIDGDRPPWWIEVAELVRRGGRADAIAGLPAERAARALKDLPQQARLQALEELRRTAASPCPPYPQLTGAELLRLRDGGVAIGNHSLTHPCFDRCDEATVRHEVVASHQRLTELLGEPPRLFAYPNGEPHPAAVPALAELEYEAAFLFDHRHAALPAADRFAVSRLRVSSHTPLDRFRIIASGLHPALHRLLGRS